MPKKGKAGGPITFIVAIIVAMALLHRTFPLITVVTFPMTYGGALLAVLGVWVSTTSKAEFQLHGVPTERSSPSVKLYTQGWFSRSRNPMYLGMMVTVLGVAVLLGSLLPFLLWGVLVAAFDRVFIPWEERKLERDFGKAFLEYKKSVPKWI